MAISGKHTSHMRNERKFHKVSPLMCNYYFIVNNYYYYSNLGLDEDFILEWGGNMYLLEQPWLELLFVIFLKVVVLKNGQLKIIH